MTTEQKPPSTIASELAEAVRRLNHATKNISEMTAPEISSTVGHLADAVSRLPQTFEQLANHLERQLLLDAVRMEDGRDSAAPVAEVIEELRRAATITSREGRATWRSPAGQLAQALANASGWLFNMGAVYTPDAEDDLPVGDPCSGSFSCPCAWHAHS